MSPSPKSKSKDKKTANDLQKTPIKASGSLNANIGAVVGAYNPLLGTFQSIGSLSTTGSSYTNGRYRNIDESDSTGADCDSVSNNGSWSGDSEDHKEKVSNPSAKQEIIPGADNDKREKIRLKNERKHQRQKEKRAQELHEKCSQYLMSRKLEVLAQQLVAMGISQDRATLALMSNQGKIEESINWLFDQEGVKETERKIDSTPGNLKIDISEEFGKILDMETRHKCSKQEVERAVVAAEGDIEKAEDILRKQKQEQSTSALRKQEENSDKPVVVVNNKLTTQTQQSSSQNTAAQLQPKAGLYPNVQEVRDPRGSLVGGVSESVNHNLQAVDRIQMKLEWMKLQNTVLGEKTWMGMGSNTPMLYHQPAGAPLMAEEAHYIALGNQFKKLQQQDMREPVMLLHQHSRSANANPIPVSAMPSGAPNGWAPQSNGFVPNITATRNPLTPNELSTNLTYQQLQYHQYQGSQVNGFRSEAVAAASSLGLFCGNGSMATSGPSASALDWNTGGSMGQLDYTNIDWSLNKTPSGVNPNRQYMGSGASYNPNRPGMRTMVNGNGSSVTGRQDVSNSREWTSPFEGKDLFSLSRQSVYSPSL